MSRWRELAEGTAFAVLATITSDGRPHLVPIVHAVVGDRIVTAVDHKPKRTRALARLSNIEGDERVAVLFDARDDDWRKLWWVRADGTATVTEDPPPDLASRLVERHEPYRAHPPAGPWIVVTVDSWSGWSAS